MTGGVTQPAQLCPVADRSELVDQAYEPVEISAMDQCVEDVIGHERSS